MYVYLVPHPPPLKCLKYFPVSCGLYFSHTSYIKLWNRGFFNDCMYCTHFILGMPTWISWYLNNKWIIQISAGRRGVSKGGFLLDFFFKWRVNQRIFRHFIYWVIYAFFCIFCIRAPPITIRALERPRDLFWDPFGSGRALKWQPWLRLTKTVALQQRFLFLCNRFYSIGLGKLLIVSIQHLF